MGLCRQGYLSAQGTIRTVLFLVAHSAELENTAEVPVLLSHAG